MTNGHGDGRRRQRSVRRHGGARPAPVRPVAGARPVDRPRLAAFQVLRAVHGGDAYANLALPALLSERGLTGRDAAFATELCYGTLRTTGTLDAILGAIADRPLSKLESAVHDALRLGVYQLLYTRVPAHAAVSTSVALVRGASGAAAARFVNAILRRVAARDLNDWLATVTPADPVAALAIRYSHPEWIVQAFAAALGDSAELEDLLAADNGRPAVHLAARPGRIEAAELARRVGGEVGRWAPTAVYLPGGAPGDLAEVRDGLAGVQDEGSQLVALAVANAPLSGPDETWLDLCAGPGGKAALLGAVAAQRGATLTAVEVAEHRAGLVAKATAGLPVRVVNADGRTVGDRPDLPACGFDRVLVDAPCTGLGALRRRPEARWRRTEADLAELTTLQRELLIAACRAARQGGIIGYVTCSPHLAETAEAVAALLAGDAVSVESVDARDLLPSDLPGLGDGPSIQLWPHRHGSDAMYLALLRRL